MTTNRKRRVHPFVGILSMHSIVIYALFHESAYRDIGICLLSVLVVAARSTRWATGDEIQVQLSLLLKFGAKEFEKTRCSGLLVLDIHTCSLSSSQSSFLSLSTDLQFGFRALIYIYD